MTPEFFLNLQATILQNAKDLTELRETMQRAQPVDPGLVLNPATNVVHKILCGELRDSSDNWKTYCGFKFGQHAHVRTEHAPPGARMCRSCHPSWPMPRGADTTSTSSSSSSSSEADS